MKKIIILLFFMTTAAMSNSYNNSQKDEFGIALGANIGYGLTYKYRLDDFLALRFTGGFFTDNNNAYNMGLEIDYSLKKNNDMDFYFSLGALHTYEDWMDYDNYDGTSSKSYEKDTRAMIGLGVSSYVSDIISISFEIHQIFEYSIGSSRESEVNIYPMIGFSLGFLF